MGKLGYFHQPKRWSRWIAGSILVLTATLVVATVTPSSAVASSRHTQTVRFWQVQINAGRSLGTIPSTAFGINDAAWDNHLLDPGLPGMVRRAGVKVMRYPGGSTSDFYSWQSNTTVPSQGGVDPKDTFDAFMGVVQAMITVNYGSGTPQEAAGWVQYANKGGPGYTGPVPTYAGGSRTGHTYGIKYWEIGNEVYGNGTYGATWEYDLHSRGPTTYAKNVVAYSQAMKAVDSSIKVGLVLTTPGIWPDGVTSASSPQPWNDTVLPIACSSIDFVVAHWYPEQPGEETDAGLLAAPRQIAGMVSTLRSKISQYCGVHARTVQIMITETNSVSFNPGKQTVSLVNALYLAEDYMGWLEKGVANVNWWDLHNSIVTGTNDGSSLYGTARYGDYGILSSGETANGISEPPADTPFPPYYGLQMLTKLARTGDRMIAASSNQDQVAVYAVKQTDGDIALLLINTDPSTGYLLHLFWSAYTPGPDPTVYFYGQHSTSITVRRKHGLLAAFSQFVPPYSLTTLVVSPRFHQ